MIPTLLGLAALGLMGYAVVNRGAMGLVADWKAGDMKRLEVLVPGAWWWGAVIFAGILAALAVTHRWWRGPWRQPEMPARRPLPWWFLATLAGVMVLGGALRAPRMDLSFYNDESYSFRRHVAGAQVPARGDKPSRFRPALWTETCYQNLTGNNSMVFSVLGRLSYDTWRKATGSAPGTVSEWAVRLPVFLCAVASIGVMGWLGRRVAGPVTGVVVALLTAFHPWHVRYSTEARCYGILMLLMPLLFLALDQARRTGRWRAWLAFGLLEYLTVACFFGAVHFLLGLNLLVAGAALWAWKKVGGLEGKRVGLSGIVPLVVSGTLAAGVYLALNLPLFLQTARLVADPTYLHNPFTLEWFQDAGSFLSFGVPGPARLADGGLPVSFGQISEKAPWLAAGCWRDFAGCCSLAEAG